MTQLEAVPNSTDARPGDAVEIEKKLGKLRKKLDDPLVEELDDMSEQDLRQRIVRCQMNILESESARDADDRLQSLKDEIREVAGPYRDAITHQKRVMKYASLLLQREEA